MAEPKSSAQFPVITPAGKTGYLPQEFVADAAKQGVRKPSVAELRAAQAKANATATEQARQADLDAKFGGLGGAVELTAGADIAGGLRGVTAGLSDVVAIEGAGLVGGQSAADAVRAKLRDYQEAAPLRSTSSELSGIVGGTMLGNEGGLLETPASLIGKAGKSAGAVFEGVGGAAGKVLRGATSGAVEGALYGAGKTASDAALQNEELTGQKLVAGTTHGALFGGAIGGALAGAGSLISGLRAPTAARAGVEAAEAAPKGSIADRVQEAADQKLIKALGGSAGDLRKLEGTVPGGYRRVAQDIAADYGATTGKSIGTATRESLHEYAAARNQELGTKLGTMLEGLDAAKTGVAPDARKFVAEVQSKLTDPLMVTRPDGLVVPMPGQEKVVKALTTWTDNITAAFEGGEPTFKVWQKMRVGLDKEIYAGAAKASPKVEALREMRKMMEAELMAAGEKAAQSMGSSFQAEYQATKALYQSTAKAVELTERGLSRGLANNSLGLTSRIAGTVMGAAGLSTSGPVGGLVAGGIATGIGKVIQDRGDLLAADLLSRAAGVMGARQIAARVEGQMARGVAGLLEPAGVKPSKVLADLGPPSRPSAAPLGVALSGNKRSDYQKVAAQVTAASANPVATSDRIAKSVGQFGDHSPKVAASAIATTMRGLAFLYDKLPPSRQDQYSLQPHLEKPLRTSDAEASKFMRYAQAVDDPLIVLREAKTGTLSRDHVEAVKAVYPDLYEEMRGQVMRTLIDSKSPLPYGRRIQLGILLDIPTDKTLSPEFLTAIQATYTSEEQAGAESPPPSLERPLNVAGTEQTAMQQAAGRVQ
jgi:hypothetical protein